MRLLECQIFPIVLIFEDDETKFYKLIKKSNYHDVFPTPGTASTISFYGEGMGAIVVVALGEPLEDEGDAEVESILTHEAVHVKQFCFESIGEDKPGVEVEAYTVQYFADYLIKEWHYRQNKRATVEEKK